MVVGINVNTRRDSATTECAFNPSVTYDTPVSCENWARIAVSPQSGSTQDEVTQLFGNRKPDDVQSRDGYSFVSWKAAYSVDGYKSKDPSYAAVIFNKHKQAIGRTFHSDDHITIRKLLFHEVRVGQSKREVSEMLGVPYDAVVVDFMGGRYGHTRKSRYDTRFC